MYPNIPNQNKRLCSSLFRKRVTDRCCPFICSGYGRLLSDQAPSPRVSRQNNRHSQPNNAYLYSTQSYWKVSTAPSGLHHTVAFKRQGAFRTQKCCNARSSGYPVLVRLEGWHVVSGRPRLRKLRLSGPQHMEQRQVGVAKLSANDKPKTQTRGFIVWTTFTNVHIIFTSGSRGCAPGATPP